MKKIILIAVGSLLLTLPMAGNVFAVWPPSTELEEEAKAAASTAPAQNLGSELSRPRPDRSLATSTGSPSAQGVSGRGLADRLEDDERRLHNVLQDLEKDSKDLKRSSSTSETGAHSGQ